MIFYRAVPPHSVKLSSTNETDPYAPGQEWGTVLRKGSSSTRSKEFESYLIQSEGVTPWSNPSSNMAKPIEKDHYE